jgi:hypothetical protein
MIALAAGLPLKGSLAAAPGRQTTKTQMKSATGPSTKAAARPTTLSPQAQSDMLQYYTKATFTAHINSLFQLRSKRVTATDVRLIEVKDTGPVPDQRPAGKECFSLLFLATRKLPQDTFTVKHSALGTFLLVIAPVGQNKKGYYLEAVINRLNP